MKRQGIRDLIRSIIADRRRQIVAEIDDWSKKINGTMFYYGCGGPYERQLAAREKREKELEDLNEFEHQIDHLVDLDRIKTFSWYCRECGAVTMTTKMPGGDWHECGSCRRMINKANVLERHLEVTRTCDFGALMRRLKEEDTNG